MPHDLLEIHVSTDFLFQIQLFLGEFLFECRALALPFALHSSFRLIGKCGPRVIHKLMLPQAGSGMVDK